MVVESYLPIYLFTYLFMLIVIFLSVIFVCLQGVHMGGLKIPDIKFVNSLKYNNIDNINL